ncbi:MAG: pyridoxine 5'-phosphate synthase [Candidatus Omnitrophica bacterium]|nr:pyridoxine 5'-phosphate synthase [Candidatus Omnitrophota bacterium]MBU3934271.1 pyridoxine 5'-phosphate synthase [Candidatus Omnitrophota bacterium]MBU4140557.1 pyridoxine 5'-phosphate synthase [Candidatus Omnitrophota bacterium]
MKLGVNIDHVATLRQARGGGAPDPIVAARICSLAGCHSIVCHLREDRRHINDEDVKNLRKIVKTKLNLEMSCAKEIVGVALRMKPDQATLVPERRKEITTEGGLDVIANRKTISRVVKTLSSAGIPVSLFIDPEEPQVEAAKQAGVECIELHTGRYANAATLTETEIELQNLLRSARFARGLSLKVFAGHGLNYENVKQIVEIGGIEELNIGHSIIARAVFSGLENAVKEMLALLRHCEPRRGEAIPS